jgi:hypothetical protein
VAKGDFVGEFEVYVLLALVHLDPDGGQRQTAAPRPEPHDLPGSAMTKRLLTLRRAVRVSRVWPRAGVWGSDRKPRSAR